MKLEIIYRRRPIDMASAVVEATTYTGHEGGKLEAMQARADAQDAMIARMLNVQFSQYHEDFTDEEFYPKTDADKLAYILGHTVIVVEA
jgi:hypothetical protein